VTLFLVGPPYEVTGEDLGLVTAGAYALYDGQRPFVEAAVQALFGAVEPAGALPVSVEAIGYNLLTQTEPDPNQSIELFIGEEPGPETPVPQLPILSVGTTIIIRTGLIVDRNGHPVPDGTPVQFTVVYQDAGNAAETFETMTAGGVAVIPVTINFIGQLEIAAISEPARNSVRLQLAIFNDAPAVVQTIPPRPTPSRTRPPTVTPTRAPTRTPTVTPVPLGSSLLGAEPRRVNLIDFALSMLGITLVSAWGYRRESKRREDGAIDRAMRLTLLGSLCGLIAYAGYGLGLPGADAVRGALGSWAALVVTLVGTAVPWLVDGIQRLSTDSKRING
jgi:beta-N-acetylhexosaminidase